jgi:hypothetical protein
MAKCRSVEFTLDAKQQVPELKVVASLSASNELSEAAVDVVVRNVQAAAGPGSAEIRADIASRPIVWWFREGLHLYWHVCSISCNAYAERNECGTLEKQISHGWAPRNENLDISIAVTVDYNSAHLAVP